MKRMKRAGHLVCALVLLSGCMLLGACGEAKVPDEITQTSYVIDEEGGVTVYLVDSFDKSYYDVNDLAEMAREDAVAFNDAHQMGTETMMSIESVSLLDGGLVRVAQRFADSEALSTYIGETFTYTEGAAVSSDVLSKVSFFSVKEGGEAETEEVIEAAGKGHVIQVPADIAGFVYCPKKVLYVSVGATVAEDGSVDCAQAENAVTIITR